MDVIQLTKDAQGSNMLIVPERQRRCLNHNNIVYIGSIKNYVSFNNSHIDTYNTVQQDTLDSFLTMFIE